MGTRKTAFDRKFGPLFIASVPTRPGIYEMLGPDGAAIYVGKAKNLRRRLQQYRSARRCKAHHKMRVILNLATAIRIQPCETELEALLLENRLIQDVRPALNVDGAFAFLYPALGLHPRGSGITLCYTTAPSEHRRFEMYGAYRSRQRTREAFRALLEILDYVGHREHKSRLAEYPTPRYTRLAAFRQIGPSWADSLRSFLRGESSRFLEEAFTHLLDKPSARRRAALVQDSIDALVRFYRFEAKPLREAIATLGLNCAFVTQSQRDSVLLVHRHRPIGSKTEPDLFG